MEKAARGQKDMVLGYVRSLGTQGEDKGGGVSVGESGRILEMEIMMLTHLTAD